MPELLYFVVVDDDIKFSFFKMYITKLVNKSNKLINEIGLSPRASDDLPGLTSCEGSQDYFKF